MEILEIKSTITKIKGSVDMLNSRKQVSEERISELENINKITQPENRKKKNWGKKLKRASGASEMVTKDLTFMTLSPRRR